MQSTGEHKQCGLGNRLKVVFLLQMTALAQANQEVAGDSDSEEDDEEGMGDIDVDAPPALSVEA